MKKIDIKKYYHDALYWATSTKTKGKTKGKDYHITRIEEAILRKLIHYSTSNEKITYSNEIITEHTFIGVATLKKAIPSLCKKGYISFSLNKIFDKGVTKTRRTIFIKWDRLEFILLEIPKPEEQKDVSTPIEDSTDSSEDFQIEKEQEEITFGAGEEISTAPEVEVVPEVKKSEFINETVIPTEDKTKFQTFYEKCVAEGQAEKKAKEDAEKNRIITFEEFAKDYTIDEEISEVLTPIADISPFMANGKLKVNFNKSNQFISINSDNDEEIKLPNIRNRYYPELFDIPKNINHLEYRKDWKPNKYLLEMSENNIEPERSNSNDDDNNNSKI